MKQAKAQQKKNIHGFVVILLLLFFLIDSFYDKTTETVFVFSYIMFFE